MNRRTTTFRDSVGKTVSVGIVGDVDFSTYCNSDDCRNPLDLLRPIFEQTDIVIANVETVITDKEYKSNKRGILLKSPVCSARFLHDAGVDLALLANNHIDDFGVEGTADTVANLEAVGLKCFGLVGKPNVVCEKNNIRFIMSGFGTTWQDTSVVPPYGTTPGTILNNKKANVGEGLALYFVHGFEELYSVPFPWRYNLLKVIANDVRPAAVICGHSHVYQGWIMQQKTPVCLSYGNGFMNLGYHSMVNKDSCIGCYSVMHFDEKGCFGIDEYLYGISTEGIVEVSDETRRSFWRKIDGMHEDLKSSERLQKAWENCCYEVWRPKGIYNWPLIRRIYDRHRGIKRQAIDQHDTIYGRAMRAAYLKRQYGLDVFELRSDEEIKVED